MTRVLAAAAFALMAAGCGTNPTVEAAAPQTLGLGWKELCTPRRQALFTIFSTLIVAPGRWRVIASVENRTGVPLLVTRPHFPGAYFGLGIYTTGRLAEIRERERSLKARPQLLATAFSPPLPRVLQDGARWSGTFSGPGAIPRGRHIRIVVGKFAVLGPVPRGLYSGFLCVSEHSRVL